VQADGKPDASSSCETFSTSLGMALTDRPNTSSPDTSDGMSGVQLIGNIDSRDYEEHAQSPAVQEMIARARRLWLETHGYDPAAPRFEALS